MPKLSTNIRFALVFLLLGFLPIAHAFAQRDAPVFYSHLNKISIEIENKKSVTFDLQYTKHGGPHEHFEHQMYLMVYLADDEAEILRLARDKTFLDKKADAEKQIIDVLVKKKLITTLDIQVGKKSKDGKHTFPFKFKIEYDRLFESLAELGKFDKKKTTAIGRNFLYDQKIQFMAFVPVNDSKYADRVDKKLNGKHDFAHFMDDNTPLLYFKPLPYQGTLYRISDGSLAVYLN